MIAPGRRTGQGMESDGQGEEEVESPAAARPARRVADRILAAVHAACDQSELETAADLLRILEALVLHRPHAPASDANRRRYLEALVAAHERLWYLRHPRADKE
jgi:hypothetical protein